MLNVSWWRRLRLPRLKVIRHGILALAIALTVISFGTLAAAQTGHALSFKGLSVPLTDADKRDIRASNQVTLNGSTYAIDYHTLVRTGQRVGDEVFGLLRDKDGDPIKAEDGSEWVCTNGSGPDHTSILSYDGELYAITQLECTVGGAYITKLNQAADGTLTAVSTSYIDAANVYGLYVNCAGMTTPWNTHLGSEEYEIPMAVLRDLPMNDAEANPMDVPYGVGDDWHDAHIWGIATYNKLDLTPENIRHFGYYFGWTPEIFIDSADGDTHVEKHYAMGRFAHELAYVMPDERTVYLSDDGQNVGLFMFVADAPQDLSAGTLYAARWNQTSPDGAGLGTADLDWISLGHATNAEIEAKLQDQSFTFDSLWDKAEMGEGDVCPTGYTGVAVYDEGKLCVRLKPGMAKYASRLETRLYAAYLGATTELNKEEGITYNPEDQVLYVAMSRVERGMESFQRGGEANPNYDVASANHVRVGYNPCGAVYALDVVATKQDSAGNAIASDYVVGNMYPEVSGALKDYAGTEYEGNTCDVDRIAEPDNLSYLPQYKVLLIGEDTGRHQNDMVWAYDVDSQALTRIATTPYGAETTSPFWHTNINGYGYVTLVTQHPFGESDEDKITSPEDRESYVGYIGPFPALD
jgi:secreted PhoX family phosphatase